MQRKDKKEKNEDELNKFIEKIKAYHIDSAKDEPISNRLNK